MAITVPHTPAGNVASTNSSTLAVTITAPTGGNLLVCCAAGFANVSSIAGGGVTTWTRIQFLSADASHNDVDVWYGVVDTTPSTTVTVTYGSSVSFRAAWVIELAGAQKANENAVAFANDAQATSDSKVITTTTNGDIIISAVSLGGATAAATAPTGYTNVGLKSITTNGIAVAYLIQTTAGASTMNWTGFTNNTFPAMGGVAIKSASGGATDVLPLTVASRSTIGFTTSGVDALSLPVASRSTIGFTTSGSDKLTLTVVSGSAIIFTTSGVDNLALPITSSSTVGFTTSGTDHLSLPVSSTSVAAFSLTVTSGGASSRQVCSFPFPLFLGVVNANQARARSFSRQ